MHKSRLNSAKTLSRAEKWKINSYSTSTNDYKYKLHWKVNLKVNEIILIKKPSVYPKSEAHFHHILYRFVCFPPEFTPQYKVSIEVAGTTKWIKYIQMHNKVKKRIRENVSPWPQFVDCRGQGYNAFYTYGAFVRVWYERAAEKVQINCDAFLFCYCKWYKYTERQCTQLDKRYRYRYMYAPLKRNEKR